MAYAKGVECGEENLDKDCNDARSGTDRHRKKALTPEFYLRPSHFSPPCVLKRAGSTWANWEGTLTLLRDQ